MRYALHYRAPRYLDRTLALETGEVRPTGIELRYEAVRSIGGSFAAVCHGTVDAAEVLLADALAAAAREDDRVVALPIFPARRFAQRYIYVRDESALGEPTDLDGRRTGWPSGAATAAVWTRKLAAEAHASPDFIEGSMGGLLKPILDRGPVGGDPLPAQLLDGKIDALVTPYAVPDGEGGDRFRLLVREPRAHERTQILNGHGMPISNVVVLRRELYERHRWFPCALLDAFAESQRLGRERMNYFGALAVGLPFLSTMLEEIDQLFGGEAFRYGVPANRALLEAFTEHAAALGVISRAIPLDELFPIEILDHPGVPDETAYDVPMAGTC
jgi:4,5-dihydroxyphthalate decarboxylase